MSKFNKEISTVSQTEGLLWSFSVTTYAKKQFKNTHLNRMVSNARAAQSPKVVCRLAIEPKQINKLTKLEYLANICFLKKRSAIKIQCRGTITKKQEESEKRESVRRGWLADTDVGGYLGATSGHSRKGVGPVPGGTQ